MYIEKIVEYKNIYTNKLVIIGRLCTGTSSSYDDYKNIKF